MIIVVTGYPSSGKSTVSEMIEQKTNDTKEVRTGDVTRSEFENEHNREHKNSDELGDWVTEKMENDDLYFARSMVEYIEEENSKNIILSGLRRKNEFDYIKENIETEFIIIHIETDFEKRYQRVKNRNREGEGDFTREDMKDRDEREEKWGLPDMIENKEIQIYNNSKLEDLEDSVSLIISEIIE
jgi:dephospho-CoA kinase